MRKPKARECCGTTEKRPFPERGIEVFQEEVDFIAFGKAKKKKGDLSPQEQSTNRQRNGIVHAGPEMMSALARLEKTLVSRKLNHVTT